MRQRVTFLHKPEDGIDPALLKVTDSSLTGPSLKAAREDRVTLALEELPEELRQDSFTPLPNDRFSHSTAFQYYQPLEDLSPFIKYAHEELCPVSYSTPPEKTICNSRADHLLTASSLDISYDTISHALKVTSTWGLQEQPLTIASPDNSNHRIEVGILGTDEPYGIEAHELGLSGTLTVLGQDKKPSATIFKFPARHRHIEDASFSTEFLEPTGLHPALQIQLNGEALKAPNADADDGSHCSLHAYLTLPRAIFADKYQLSDPLFLASKNLTALRYITQPVDLEAPAYTMKPWGSAALLELSPPPAKPAGSPWTAEVPLHLRYQSPTLGGYKIVEAPYPAVFWACTTEEGTKFPSSPFERVNLGYDGLFGPRTVFWHVDPAPKETGGRLINQVRVPVLDMVKSEWISAGTAAVVLLGFGWIVWKLIAVYLKTGYGPAKQMKALEKKEQ
ncbi:Protein pbn1 [Cytospora mali]|uniref:Protein PBN1 n=1 Tax=Cytospora mali TaxID=578113 RepID=A0A194V4D7_CYTMA|nr:Protein pbn1 [Valsa mali var. pyri (nom. inval.)]